jgi:hypothetical protein
MDGGSGGRVEGGPQLGAAMSANDPGRWLPLALVSVIVGGLVATLWLLQGVLRP